MGGDTADLARRPPAEPAPDAERPAPTGAAADVIFLERAPLRLVLAQSDTALSLRRSDGLLITLPFDGRDVVVERPDRRGQLHLSGRWQGPRFAALVQLAGGLVFVERYEISGDGSRLTVKARLYGDAMRREVGELRRVYQRGDR
jgi:hypothetical protein